VPATGAVGHTGEVPDREPDIEPEIETEFAGSPRPPTKVPGVWRQIPFGVKILLVGLLLAASVGIYSASRLTSQSEAQFDNGVVVQLIPNDGDKVLQQAQAGIRLADGYTGTLTVNGVPVPDDQLDRVQALNEILFQPGDAKIVEAWPAGENCLVATYWKSATGPTQSSTHTWCFSVV
jgi:hypothetical protein